MSTSKKNLMSNEWEMSTIERKYSVPQPGEPLPQGVVPGMGDLQAARGDRGSTSEDLHAWSIYRQNLNSDFTDSALGSSEKSPLPYGNFQLRESTVQSILNHPRYGPKSALSSNMYTYLKFGLPRVFPPSRGRDGSSGYNSSDDGSPGPLKGAGGRGPTRTRSEMDFRNLHIHSGYPMPPQQRNGRISNSEANLLSVGQYYHQDQPRTRRSVAAMERSYRPSEHRQAEHRKSFHDLRSTTMMDSTFQRSLTEQRRASKAGSHLSLGHRKLMPHSSVPDFAAAAVAAARSQSAMGHIPYYGAPVQTELGPFQYPHLQVRNLEIESSKEKGRYIVQGVTFEVRGGELLSIMSTQASEGTALLTALSGGRRRSHGLGKVSAELVLNGNLIDRRHLAKRSAFVDTDTSWDEDLTVRQTLVFQYRLRRVKSRFAKVPLDDRVSSLIEDLGLDQVSGTKLSGLTQSELRRLSVGVHLLLDVDILFLDQPTKGMDIFDTFFLIEYLRQWCLNASMPDMTGRAVVLTLQPPTYEILTMLSRLVILSNGHVMYCGLTSMLLPYFTSVEYPCPSYKNPSDYYLDLVTLDDLSAEAMLESSQRMAQLGELQRRRQEPLSDPGPPVPLPPVLRHANGFQQAGTLFLRSLLWSQPSSFIRYLFYILLAAVLSFLVGAIFWDIPASDTQLTLGDRLGFHHTVLCVAHWPLLLLVSLSSVRRERKFVWSEVTDELYSGTTFILLKVLCSLPGHFIMWLAYLVPAYIMSGLHYQGSHSESTRTFYLYVTLCLIYLHALQLLATALSWLCHRTAAAVVLIALLYTSAFMMSGYPLHVDDAGGANSVGGYLRMASPAWWVTSTLMQRELRQDAFKNHNHVCRNKQKQKPDVIVQIACPTPNGTAELEYQSMLPQKVDWMGRYNVHSDNAYIVLGMFWLVSLALLWIMFCIAIRIPRKRRKINQSTNKP